MASRHGKTRTGRACRKGWNRGVDGKVSRKGSVRDDKEERVEKAGLEKGGWGLSNRYGLTRADLAWLVVMG